MLSPGYGLCCEFGCRLIHGSHFSLLYTLGSTPLPVVNLWHDHDGYNAGEWLHINCWIDYLHCSGCVKEDVFCCSELVEN